MRRVGCENKAGPHFKDSRRKQRIKCTKKQNEVNVAWKQRLRAQCVPVGGLSAAGRPGGAGGVRRRELRAARYTRGKNRRHLPHACLWEAEGRRSVGRGGGWA